MPHCDFKLTNFRLPSCLVELLVLCRLTSILLEWSCGNWRLVRPRSVASCVMSRFLRSARWCAPIPSAPYHAIQAQRVLSLCHAWTARIWDFADVFLESPCRLLLVMQSFSRGRCRCGDPDSVMLGGEGCKVTWSYRSGPCPLCNWGHQSLMPADASSSSHFSFGKACAARLPLMLDMLPHVLYSVPLLSLPQWPSGTST